jgi:hypothetical protein
MELMLRWTDQQMLSETTPRQPNMGMPKVSARQIEDETHPMNSYELPGLGLTSKQPKEEPRNEPCRHHPAKPVEEAFHRMAAIESGWREDFSRVMYLVETPQERQPME